MSLKIVVPFLIFAPPNPISTTPTSTDLRLPCRRWGTAAADTHESHLQFLTHDEIRHRCSRRHCFPSSTTLSNPAPDSSALSRNPYLDSRSSGSTPSRPSPRRRKPQFPKEPPDPESTHPAFRRLPRKSKLPPSESSNQAGVKIAGSGVSYLVPGAPFEYMYSYTETPKVKPLALREPPVAPFGNDAMPRPWTGRKPLPPSKKKLPEFDSFVLPPPDKKGVKPVQKPGPFLPGTGPMYVMSREKILGEPLTKEEVRELVDRCMKSKRQLNMGRDGLTHNMLDNIHALWKRRRVCKIKCKGVCTVDMDNVCQQLEEKTGGKIIHRKGGVLYLFRGRNYNYKTRPRYPLMLWKPVTPVYPRLVKRVPEGLTLEEVTEMRRKGRTLIPICMLGKNGVYLNLVRNVKEAFEACELVRINCQGMNGSDFHKIGAKLKDLVPCVLISFENEHILLWRGRDWKSSLTGTPEDSNSMENTEADGLKATNSSHDHSLPVEGKVVKLIEPYVSSQETSDEDHFSIAVLVDVDEPVLPDEGVLTPDSQETPIFGTYFETSPESLELDLKSGTYEASSPEGSSEAGLFNSGVGLKRNLLISIPSTYASESVSSDEVFTPTSLETIPVVSDVMGHSKHQQEHCATDEVTFDELQDKADSLVGKASSKLSSPCEQRLLLLLREAIASGSAVLLNDSCLGADVVYERSVAFAKVVPPGPVFMRRRRKIVENYVNLEDGEMQVEEVVPDIEKKVKERRSYKTRSARDFRGDPLNVVPQGSLGVDGLAKLLA